jgi:1-acyl-sn-glycerol-3-phosphate acyltransferase
MTGQTGAARLALMTGAPVIPLASWGAHELLPYRKGEKGGLAGSLKPGFHPFPRKKIQIIAGPEVDLSRYRDQPITAAILHDATADIMRANAGPVGQLRQQSPPADLYDRHQTKDRGQDRPPDSG